MGFYTLLGQMSPLTSHEKLPQICVQINFQIIYISMAYDYIKVVLKY